MMWLANWLARRLWWGMMWWMRLPRIKRLRHRVFGFAADSPNRARREAILKQEMLARRHGLTILRYAILFLELSIIFTLLYSQGLRFMEQGFMLRPGQ
jgi:hypothetical protein